MTEPLKVTWYTDPHNIWCWGCEPMMRRLEVVYADVVRLEARPIHRESVQTEVAGEVGLDVAEFSKSLEDGRAKAAFEADRAESERLEVRGFPTFTIGRGEVTARLNGWQPWEVFEEALRQ